MATVMLLGALDTKGDEYAFIRDRVIAAGCDVVMINAGVLGDPEYPIEFSRHEVAAEAGADIEALVAAGDRGTAVTAMAEGAASIIQRLCNDDQIHGILGVGGSGGSSIVSHAMRQLPIGFPKLLVSTMAAGDVSAYVGTSDIAMMYSVVDIAGINAVSSSILGNAAAGVAAMATAYEARIPSTDTRPLVGATMYGTTTQCVNTARDTLDQLGYEVLVFHATGTGGRSMEALMKSGYITASLDVTTTEIVDEIAGGTLTAGPDRLEAAGALGLPQVVSIGATDQITFTPPQAVPAEYRDRNCYKHNPSITLVRSNAEECEELGRIVADKLNRALGPVSLFVPLRGGSSYAVAGGVFHDPVADAALLESLRIHLDPSVELVEMDTDINDPAFAEAMALRLDEHYQRWAAEKVG
ncbi:MAG: Tm-1-like ATP-binding domain-containing protein [Acidimicrobiia bacterium]